MPAIDFEGISTGAKTADSLDPTNFTNTAGTNTARSNWLLSGTKNELIPTVEGLALRTVASSRDQEVTFWSRRGTLTLRETATKALYLHHNGESTNGTVTIGIVYGGGFPASGAQPADWSDEVLWTTTNALGVISGYSKTDTAGQAFTFGCEGVDVYAELNGVEFVRFQEFRHVTSGKSAVYCVSTYGVRSMDVDFLADASLFSDFDNMIIDARDFGMKRLVGRGSINASGTALIMDSNPGFAAGDHIIVATGGEWGLGKRGSAGIGGTWPTLSYANATARAADTGQANNTYAWQRDTGDVWRWSSGGSSWAQQTSYYVEKAQARALRAKVSSVSGNLLTLDTAATNAAGRARVYFDNAPLLNKLLSGRPQFDGFRTTTYNSGEIRDLRNTTPGDMTVRLPAGRYAVGDRITIRERPGWILEGAGKSQTTLYSPYGCMTATVQLWSSTGAIVRELGVRSNKTDVRYSWFIGTWDPDEANRIATQTNVPSDAYAASIRVYLSDDAEVAECRAEEPLNQGILIHTSDNVLVRRSSITQDFPQLVYVQWLLQAADSTAPIARDIDIYSSKLVAGAEPFSCDNVLFERVACHNASFSANNANGEFLDCSVIVDDDALTGSPSFDKNNPLVNINTNVGSAKATSFDVTDMEIEVIGYLNSDNDICAGIVVNASNPDVTITGGGYTGPDYAAPSTLKGPQGVRSTGTNTVVDGFVVWGDVTGTPSVSNANIGVDDGAIRNCIANTIYGSPGVTLENNSGH